jgi:hypothetical protein
LVSRDGISFVCMSNLEISHYQNLENSPTTSGDSFSSDCQIIQGLKMELDRKVDNLDSIEEETFTYLNIQLHNQSHYLTLRYWVGI